MEEFGIKKKILLLWFEVICVEDEGRIMLTYFFYITSNIWIRMRVITCNLNSKFRENEIHDCNTISEKSHDHDFK